MNFKNVASTMDKIFRQALVSRKLQRYGNILISIFQQGFASIEKIFTFGGRLCTSLYNSMKFLDFPDLS